MDTKVIQVNYVIGFLTTKFSIFPHNAYLLPPKNNSYFKHPSEIVIYIEIEEDEVSDEIIHSFYGKFIPHLGYGIKISLLKYLPKYINFTELITVN